MKNWRYKVLEHFQAPFEHLYLVSDPDQILQDEEIVAYMQAQGLELIDFHDRAYFRYLYEKEYRPKLNQNFLVIRVESESLEQLPYDLLSRGKPIYLRKKDLFPTLSASLVRQLDTAALDALSQLEDSMERDSNMDSAHFLLKRLYKLPYDEIDSEADLWALLIQKHQLKINLPRILEDILLQQLSKYSFQYPNFQLKKMFFSRQDYYAFLQTEWENFVNAGFPEGHPFWQEKLRSQLMLLFLEGKLFPVEIGTQARSSHFSFGINYDPVKEKIRRLEETLNQLELVTNENKDRRSWIEVARLFGRARNLLLQLENCEQLKQKLDQFEIQLENQFEQWIHSHYGALATLTDSRTPVMVHKVPEYLHLHGGNKKAVIVIDGMSFVQWAQIADELHKEFELYENGTFAWIPTITSVSRQAIFSGMMPKHFEDSIHTTAKEDKLWRECWRKYGIGSAFVSYDKALGQGPYERSSIKALAKDKIKVAGLVIDILDRFMHGSIQGHAGLYEEIRLWLKTGYLQSLIKDLLMAGFSVYITSDHGNKESRGIGRFNEGSLVETRGERVRIYRFKELVDLAAEQIPAYQWNRIGLPDDYYPLLARGDTAFVNEGELVVSHGGASFEEVIVPFVQVLPKLVKKGNI